MAEPIERMPLKLLLLQALLFCGVFLLAQSATSNFVVDDDGGRVQALSSIDWSAANLSYHKGAVVKLPETVSFFLGSGWANDDVRVRELRLGKTPELLSSSDREQLLGYGVDFSRATSESHDDIADLTEPLSDLPLQHRLEDAIQNGALPKPKSNTVYLVFFGPGAGASIGGHAMNEHLLGYHNFFHGKNGVVHYAVVPYNADVARHERIATRLLMQTALNPEGTGWY